MTQPPNNKEMEAALLACGFHRNETVGDMIAAGVTEDTFYQPLHKFIWQAISKSYTVGEEFDELSIGIEVKRISASEYGMQDVNDVSGTAETAVQVPIYLNECLRTQKSRKLFLGALKCLDDIEMDMDPDEVQGNLSSTLQENESGGLKDANLSEVSGKVIEDIRERNKRKTKHVGLSTGYPLLDHYLGGLRPGSVNVLAGRPGQGKTSLALQLALNMLSMNTPCRIWSLEMSEEQLIEKCLANLSEIDSARAKDGLLFSEDFEALEQARYKLSNMPLYISELNSVTVEKIAAQHRRDLVKHKNVLVIIDYLQLLRCTDRKLSREQQISSMSRDLKCLFKDTGTQVILLSQLNRNSDASAKPKLSDLRESGAIEQDADTVVFIYGEGKVSVSKNRHGAIGEVEFNFNKPISKFNQK